MLAFRSERVRPVCRRVERECSTVKSEQRFEGEGERGGAGEACQDLLHLQKEVEPGSRGARGAERLTIYRVSLGIQCGCSCGAARAGYGGRGGHLTTDVCHCRVSVGTVVDSSMSVRVCVALQSSGVCSCPSLFPPLHPRKHRDRNGASTLVVSVSVSAVAGHRCVARATDAPPALPAQRLTPREAPRCLPGLRSSPRLERSHTSY